ncbi:MAG: hypothetical protein ACRYFS_20710 [Janthinobacterium lividum]
MLRIIGNRGSTYPSDADGNTLTDSAGRVMIWDSQNRLVSCVYKGVTSTFKYGADDLRRQATVNSVTTDYAYDSRTLIRKMSMKYVGSARNSSSSNALVWPPRSLRL